MNPTTRRTATVLVLVIFTAILAAGTPAARAAGGRYIDQKHGFAIDILPKWTQVPTQPRDQLVTAKFMDGDRTETSMLAIYRFKVSGGAVATPDSVDGEEADEPEA
ncbi:MAG: hypothetical protein ABFS86_12980, partial [Planctomycetota bacterium]